ncbi:MAG: hypothetical protein BAA04_10510 [Firmicutes bacterium ZCTH02-B6]|nr:MAG: hypothetical protein BAA04_10510 [Firmicutes bacterium ZCTH02-B6]
MSTETGARGPARRDALKAEVRRHVAATLMQGAAHRPLQLAVAHIYRALVESGRWESPNGQWRLRLEGDNLITERHSGAGWETVLTGTVTA